MKVEGTEVKILEAGDIYLAKERKKRRSEREGKTAQYIAIERDGSAGQNQNIVLVEQVSRATVNRFRDFFGGQFIIWPFRRLNRQPDPCGIRESRIATSVKIIVETWDFEIRIFY